MNCHGLDCAFVPLRRRRHKAPEAINEQNKMFGEDDEDVEPTNAAQRAAQFDWLVTAIQAFYAVHQPQRADLESATKIAKMFTEGTHNVATLNKMLEQKYGAQLDMSIVNAWQTEGGSSSSAGAAAEAIVRHPLEPPS
jgi:hypothetical protein